MRKQRREGNIAFSPSKEEAEVCTKAFSLCPGYWRALHDMANLTEERMKAASHKMTPQEYRKADADLLEYLLQARTKAPHNITVALKCVEVLSAQKAESQEEEESINGKVLQILKKCEVDWSGNSQVYHKFGKFYLQVRFFVPFYPPSKLYASKIKLQRKKDKIQALRYYDKSLEIDRTNFPCLMDYLRIKLPRIEISAAIKLLLNFLPAYKHKSIYSLKLFILLGYCKYHNDDIAGAIRAWIEVFSSDDKKLTDGDKTTLRAELKVCVNMQ